MDEKSIVSDVTLCKRQFKDFESDLQSVIDKLIEEFDEDYQIFIIVSLPVLLNYKSANLSIPENVHIVSVINATQRGIYPPIACLRHFSV